MIEFCEESLQSHSSSTIGLDSVNRILVNGNSSSESTTGGNDTDEDLQSYGDSAIRPGGGCFSKALLSGRDELSFDGSTSSMSTTDNHESEGRGKFSTIIWWLIHNKMCFYYCRQHHRSCRRAADLPLHSDAALSEGEPQRLAGF